MTHVPTDSFELRNREQGPDGSIVIAKGMTVCPHCGTPLITTFSIPGAEKYCLKCKRTGDVLWGNIVKRTKKLHNQFGRYLKAFQKLEADLITSENYNRCRICRMEMRQNFRRANHFDHASPEELRRHKRTLKLLLGRNHSGKK
jgi:hypothetical protein